MGSDKVLYFHEHQPIEGTTDRQHFQASTQRPAQSEKASDKLPQPEAQALSSRQPGAQAASSRQLEAADIAERADEPFDPSFHGAHGELNNPEGLDMRRDWRPSRPIGRCADRARQAARRLDPSFDFDPANWTHFSIGVMDEEGVQNAIKWGHQRTLQLDSTHGCNAQKFALLTLLAVDDHERGIPLAYYFTAFQPLKPCQPLTEHVWA